MPRTMRRPPIAVIVVALAALLAWSAVATATTRFITPSRNIGCAGDRTEVRCDIAQTNATPPKRPTSCRFDWGSAYVITPKARRGRGLCASDTVLPSPGQKVRVLGYGKRISFGRGALVCVSRKAGLTCRNRRGHGFFLSRQRIRLF
jgi:hypothetical protein